MKKITAKRMDIAFYLKLFPLKMHPDAYWKSKSIICSKSISLLEDNFAGKPIPKVDCNTKEIDETLAFGGKNGITGTPAMVLPDGSVHSGYLDADKLINLIDAAAGTKTGKKQKK